MNKIIAAATLVATLGAAPALAADLIIDDPIITTTSAYDWDGFYAGVSGGIWNDGTSYFYFGGLLGANFVQGDWLFGLEASGEYFPDGADWTVDLTGRAGVILDNVLLYGHAGVGTGNAGSIFGIVGAGAEVGITDQISLAGQLEYVGFGGGVVRGETSLRFHF